MKMFRKPNAVLFLLSCLLISSLQTGTSSGQQAANVTILRGATVIDGLGNPPLRNAVVVIEGDEVKSLSGSGSDIPAGATVLDLTGRFIIPGLIDSHVHWSNWMGEMYINLGVTSHLAQANVSREERLDSQTSLSTPRVFHAGGSPSAVAFHEPTGGLAGHRGLFEEGTGCCLVSAIEREQQGSLSMGCRGSSSGRLGGL